MSGASASRLTSQRPLSSGPFSPARRTFGIRPPAPRCLAAVAGTVMMALMWIAEWPPAKHLSDGSASMSTNPFVDYHVVYGVVLIALAVASAGDTLGLGRLWARLPIVRRGRLLR